MLPVHNVSSDKPQRLPARSADQIAAGPDATVRCAFCDQGFLPGEVFDHARQCCVIGHDADIARGVPQ